MDFDFGAELKACMEGVSARFAVCGHAYSDGTVRPLPSDTKVLSKLFEDAVKDRLVRFAEQRGLSLELPPEQNYYPDFTLTLKSAEGRVIFRAAVDVMHVR
jgi:hypothetical protein